MKQNDKMGGCGVFLKSYLDHDRSIIKNKKIRIKRRR